MRNIVKWLCLTGLVCCFQTLTAKDFIHPGLLHGTDDLVRMEQTVKTEFIRAGGLMNC
ncbi:MAG: hypothetical protein LUH12_00470 [Bacteroides sp.]|nr:hypothetical protein [Bacteroides sp.]